MKQLLFTAVTIGAMVFSSCSNKLSTMSKNSVPFPGMTVTRADYKLSKDVTAEVEVKEARWLGFIYTAKSIGEAKNELRQGFVSGYGLDKASQIAMYRLLEANPSFDYLTNIRITKEYTKKWIFVGTKYNTKVKIVAKGITLNTEK